MENPRRMGSLGEGVGMGARGEAGLGEEEEEEEEGEEEEGEKQGDVEEVAEEVEQVVDWLVSSSNETRAC